MTKLDSSWTQVDADATAKPHLLLVGSGDANFRRYAIEDLAREYSLWLLTPRAPSWDIPYLRGFALLDVTDVAEAESLARRLADGVDLAGVLSYTETLVAVSAAISTALGFAGPDPAAVSLGRDKWSVRQKLKEAGVPQPGFATVSTTEDALASLEHLGYPAVMKPRRLAGSCGVVRVDGPDDVRAHFSVPSLAEFRGVENPAHDAVLLEQFLAGEEITVDSACQDGEVIPLVIARKQLGFDPYFEEIEHTVWADDPLYQSVELRDALQKVHHAMELENLMTHTEFRMTSEGFRLIEVNVRMGGGLIPYLGQLAHGFSLPLIAADIATGTPVDASTSKAGCAYIEFLYPPHDMVIESITVDEAGLDDDVHELMITKGPGQSLVLPPAGNSTMCHFGYLITTGSDPEHCRQVAKHTQSLITLRGNFPSGEEEGE